MGHYGISSLGMVLVILCLIDYGATVDAPRITVDAIPRLVWDLRAGVDLVILIERSKSVGRHNFYQKSLKLVNTVLSNYTRIDHFNVHVAVATFANDFTLHFNGINHYVPKCDIWDKHWKRIKIKRSKGIWNGTDSIFAFQQAWYIFERPSSAHDRYLWVISEKKTAIEMADLFSEFVNSNIILLLTTIEDEGILDIPSDRHLYYTGGVLNTLARITAYKPLERFSRLTVFNRTHYCDACGNTIGTCEGCLYHQGWIDHHLPLRVRPQAGFSSAMFWPVMPIGHECRTDKRECVCVTTKITYTCPSPVGNTSTVRNWDIVVIAVISVVLPVIIPLVLCLLFKTRPVLNSFRNEAGALEGPHVRDPSHSVEGAKQDHEGTTSLNEEGRMKLQRLHKVEELKEHLKDWLSRCQHPSGIDVDDQTLTMFCPKSEEEALLASLTAEVKERLGQKQWEYLGFYKVRPYKTFRIYRQESRIGGGSRIYHLDRSGKPLFVTLGAFFIDVIEYGLYCLTTSHLEDAKGKPFFFSSNGTNVKLGECVAYVQQTNPLLEACLIKLDRAVQNRCSALLLPERLQTPVAFRGPYTGSISELLVTPKEVMICGGKTHLTRGKMKYYGVEFVDPDTETKVCGGIVTFPSQTDAFPTQGDSGATICTASTQSCLIKDWCLRPCHAPTIQRAALPWAQEEPHAQQVNVDATANEEGVSEDVNQASSAPPASSLSEESGAMAAEVQAQPPGDAERMGEEASMQVSEGATGNEDTLTEVMTHEAISSHCFSGQMSFFDEPPCIASISFRMDLAVIKMQEMIGAELRLIPILQDACI